MSLSGNAAGAGEASHLGIQQIQFVGSHNSYKRAMDREHFIALEKRNPQAARSLEYSHIPLVEQLNLGLRKLELDVFNTARFTVGHVQDIDMNSHCTPLEDCLRQIVQWSDANPQHVPLWISINAKDQQIDGLSPVTAFGATAFARLDAVLNAVLAHRLLRPHEVKQPGLPPTWPAVDAARGKVIVILDEGGAKREIYLQNWLHRPMFTTVGMDHPAAAIFVINDPINRFDEIRAAVRAGYMVRTRADADTHEARANDTRRRTAAFASGAHAVSTDYYLPAESVGSDYQVPVSVRCNPVSAPADCRFTE